MIHSILSPAQQQLPWPFVSLFNLKTTKYENHLLKINLKFKLDFFEMFF